MAVNKQLKNTSCFDRSKLQKQNLKQLMRLTLINILNAKGVIYTYYKQQERELNINRQAHNKDNWIKIRS